MKVRKLGKEKEAILNYLSEVYGISKKAFDNFDFFEQNERIYILGKKAARVLENLNLPIDAIGFYLGRKERRGFRLSFDATQFFAEEIKKNILEIDENKAREWFFGLDLDIDAAIEKQIKEKMLKDFVVVKYGRDFVGVGLIALQRARIINYVPKDRRVVMKKEKA